MAQRNFKSPSDKLMKDLKRLLMYGGGALIVIVILAQLAASRSLSANAMVAVSILLVIVLPVLLGIFFARREKNRNDRSSGSG